MNANEGIDLTKMAVTVLMVCLVLSATLFLWYFLQKVQNDQVSEWEDAANSAAVERVYDLIAQSKDAANKGRPQDFPIVTNVANALAEFPEAGLIFVSIYDEETGLTDVYTYEGTYALLGSALEHSNFTSHESISPVSECVSDLLKRYSDRRCSLMQIDVTYDTSGSGQYIKVGQEATFVAYDVWVRRAD